MNTGRRAFRLSLLLGLVVYLIDVCMDHLLFSRGPFWNELISDVAPAELFMRLLVVAMIVLFGVLMSKAISQRDRAQKDLREAENKYRSLVEESITGVYIIQDDRFRYVNPRMAEIFGYTQQEIIESKTVMDLVAPENRELVAENLRKRLSGEIRSAHYAFEAVKKDGQPFPVEVHGARTTYQGRSAVIGVLLDITEREQAEKALQLTQFSVEHASDAAFWISPEGRFLYVNQAACRSLGYTADELLSMSVPDIDPDYTAEVWPKHWEELKEQGSMVFESIHRARDGRIFPVEINVNYLKFDGREYNFAFARDISARQQAEAERTRLANLVQALLGSTDQGLYGVGPDSLCVFVNKSGAEMLGYEPDELVGSDIHRMVHHTRKDGSPYPHDECPSLRVLHTGSGVRTEDEVLWRRDGTSFPAEMSSYPVMEHGTVTGVVVAITDITDRKNTEEILRREYEREKSIAETLQTAFLSPIDLEIEGFDIVERYKAGSTEAEVGGDFCDVYQLPDGRVVLVIGDVSGKGLHAAVQTAMAKYMLRAYTHMNGDPANALAELNEAMCEFTGESSFVTVFLAVLDPVTRSFTYSNAGHEPPLLYSHALGRAEPLVVTGSVIGVECKSHYDQVTAAMAEGDVLLIYTDGISEARSNGQFFGMEGVIGALVASAEGTDDQIADAILAAAMGFTGGRLRDDAALLALKAKSR